MALFVEFSLMNFFVGDELKRIFFLVYEDLVDDPIVWLIVLVDWLAIWDTFPWILIVDSSNLHPSWVLNPPNPNEVYKIVIPVINISTVVCAGVDADPFTRLEILLISSIYFVLSLSIFVKSIFCLLSSLL